MLGLPDGVTVCLFDLDGVLTDTASVHSAAWKEAFDGFLHTEADNGGPAFNEFTPEDYGEYVDGKPRADGVRDFLASRDITLPEGDDDDAPEKRSVTGVGNRKNQLLLKKIHEDGVHVFEGSRRYLEAARDAGFERIVVSSSANTKAVLDVTGLADLVQGRVDGNTLKEKHLAGKPAPDSFLAGARLARVTPGECAVFEDAIAGVQAGHAGKFGAVIGVDRLKDGEHADALRTNGATVVVGDLDQLLPTDDTGNGDDDNTDHTDNTDDAGVTA